jgi:hypothetical protein
MMDHDRFESAPTDRVAQYRPEINRILQALGHPDAWVTDESRVSDFPMRDDDDGPSLTELWIDLGLRVRQDDRLVDLAQRMREAAARRQRAFMPTERHAWIAWLGERDAGVLLLSLMQAIEEGSTLETLRDMVEGWRANAHQALSADDYRACADRFLEVYVDARVHIFNRDRWARAGEDEDDEGEASP